MSLPQLFEKLSGPLSFEKFPVCLSCLLLVSEEILTEYREAAQTGDAA